MPLNQTDHGDQSWEVLSRQWVKTNEHAYAKWVFANKTNVIPYGTYVLVDDSTLRVETAELLETLNERFDIVREAIIENKVALTRHRPPKATNLAVNAAVELIISDKRKGR